LQFEWIRPLKGYTLEEWKGVYFEPKPLSENEELALREKSPFTEIVQNKESQIGRRKKLSAQAPIWVRNETDPSFIAAHTEDTEGFDCSYVLVPVGHETIKFNPLEKNPTLFMEALDIGSYDALCEFMGKYGPLDHGSLRSGEKTALRKNFDPMTPRIIGPGELGFWLARIIFLAEAVTAWREAINTKNFSNLSEYFSNPASDEYGTTVVRMIHRDKNAPPQMFLEPTSLYAGMWVLFAQAVSANLQLRRCAICPVWFAFGTGTGRRKSAHYCSDKCRKAAHRRQKID